MKNKIQFDYDKYNEMLRVDVNGTIIFEENTWDLKSEELLEKVLRQLGVKVIIKKGSYTSKP